MMDFYNWYDVIPLAGHKKQPQDNSPNDMVKNPIFEKL